MLPCIVDAPQPIADRPERKTGVKFSFTSVSSEEMNGSRNALNGSVNSSLSSSRATQVLVVSYRVSLIQLTKII
jgi:hypothetical protein